MSQTTTMTLYFTNGKLEPFAYHVDLEGGPGGDNVSGKCRELPGIKASGNWSEVRDQISRRLSVATDYRHVGVKYVSGVPGGVQETLVDLDARRLTPQELLVLVNLIASEG